MTRRTPPQTLSSLLLCLALGAGPGCGPQARLSAPGQIAPPAAPRRAWRPLQRPLRVLAAPAGVRTRHGGGAGWRARRAGAEIRGVRDLQAGGQGALLAIAAPGGADREAGRIWLRGDARLRLGQDRQGALRLRLVRGEARVSLFDDRAARLEGDRGPRRIDGQDLLLERIAGGALKVLPTARMPLAADWSLALLEDTTPRAGIGSLSSGGGTAQPMELRRVQIRSKLAGDAVELELEHVFHNPSPQRLEGTFRFPLPAGASLLGLAMEINGELMEGELVERRKARRTYEKIVDEMQDPALLEWEQGNTFKLRVFPIEPRSDKRIVIRLLAPLQRSPGGARLVLDTSSPRLQRRIPSFSVQFQGRTVLDEKDFRPGRQLVLPVPAALLPAGPVRERRADGLYTALRLRPDWDLLDRRSGAAGSVPPRDVVLVLDTSRSALESRRLALQTVRTLLAGLRPQDRFLVLAADVTVRGHADGLVPANRQQQSAALAFLQAIEPDGATDLGLALAQAARRLKDRGAAERAPQLVYIGDGTATWGETDPAALRRLASAALGELPLHAVILGKGASDTLLRDLAAAQGGRAAAPRTPLEVRRFALALAQAPGAPRLRAARAVAGEQDQVYPRQPQTLFPGDELELLVRTPPGQAPPRAVTLRGMHDGRPVTQVFPAVRVAPARQVAHRWARLHLAQLQATGAEREQVVQQSLRYGVMSRHTAFLVLESEEAYRQHQIARRQKEQRARDGQPRVSGGDLESVGLRRASMSPNEMQPGDPEIRIPAPADARSVVVVFPFGETKLAHYEPDLGLWTVRFLIDQDTAEGSYQVTARVTHADGRLELLSLPYQVDTRGPRLKLSVSRHPRDPQTLIIEARQLQEQDLHRVEVQLLQGTGGRVLRMWPAGGGRYRAWWRPGARLTGPLALRVVAVDRANNRTVVQASYDPRSGALTSEVQR
jgi:hypothetical protein